MLTASCSAEGNALIFAVDQSSIFWANSGMSVIVWLNISKSAGLRNKNILIAGS